MTILGLGEHSGDAMEIDQDGRKKIRVMVWNIENFTGTERPNRRKGIGRRLEILGATLAEYSIDIAILLETGRDGGEIKVEGYTTKVTPITGKDRGPNVNYDGETYVVLYRDDLEDVKISDISLLCNGPVYRGAVYFTAEHEERHVAICALHAPSPGYKLSVRLKRIHDCCAEAQNKSGGNPLIFCGDLNIKKGEVEGAETGYSTDDSDDLVLNEDDDSDAGFEEEEGAAVAAQASCLTSEMAGLKMHHAGPGGFPETTICQQFRTLVESYKSQPYDQVWCNEALNGAENGDIRVLPPGHAQISDNIRQEHEKNEQGRIVARFNQASDLGGPGSRSSASRQQAETPAVRRMRRAIESGKRTMEGDLWTEASSWASGLKQTQVSGINTGSQRTQGYARTLQYVDALFREFNLLLLLKDHVTQRTAGAGALVERAAMSDHLPIVFEYVFPRDSDSSMEEDPPAAAADGNPFKRVRQLH